MSYLVTVAAQHIFLAYVLAPAWLQLGCLMLLNWALYDCLRRLLS